MHLFRRRGADAKKTAVGSCRVEESTFDPSNKVRIVVKSFGADAGCAGELQADCDYEQLLLWSLHVAKNPKPVTLRLRDIRRIRVGEDGTSFPFLVLYYVANHLFEISQKMGGGGVTAGTGDDDVFADIGPARGEKCVILYFSGVANRDAWASYLTKETTRLSEDNIAESRARYETPRANDKLPMASPRVAGITAVEIEGGPWSVISVTLAPDSITGAQGKSMDFKALIHAVSLESGDEQLLELAIHRSSLETATLDMVVQEFVSHNGISAGSLHSLLRTLDVLIGRRLFTRSVPHLIESIEAATFSVQYVSEEVKSIPMAEVLTLCNDRLDWHMQCIESAFIEPRSSNGESSLSCADEGVFTSLTHRALWRLAFEQKRRNDKSYAEARELGEEERAMLREDRIKRIDAQRDQLHANLPAIKATHHTE